YPLQNAQEPDFRIQQVAFGYATERRSTSQSGPHRALYEFQDGARTDRSDVCFDVRTLRPGFRVVLARDSGGIRHADRRLLLRHRLRQPGWIYRLIQQSRVRVDPLDFVDRS